VSKEYYVRKWLEHTRCESLLVSCLANLLDSCQHATRVINVPVRKHDHFNLVKLNFESPGVLEEDGWLWASVEEYSVLDVVFDSRLLR
jgi:hypothetical protein